MYKVMNLNAWGRIKAFVVTDQPPNWTKDHDMDFPETATFPISLRYDEETQRRRAYEYCDYLNKGIIVQPPIGS